MTKTELRESVEFNGEQVTKLAHENAMLRAENARMREALEVYADKDMWYIFPDSKFIKTPKEYVTVRVPLTRDEYKDYLKSDWWKSISYRKRMEANGECSVCNSCKVLVVHHSTYDNLGHEQEGDLIVVCKKCHMDIHRVTSLIYSGEVQQ